MLKNLHLNKYSFKLELHSNEIKNGNRQNGMEGDMSYDEDQINYNNINGITNDDYDDEDDDILIENEIPNVTLLLILI